MPFPKVIHRFLSLIPDKPYLKFRFWYYHRYIPSFTNPRSLNEKITWLKLYDRSDLHTKAADKFRVRELIEEVIGNQYLIPLHFKADSPHLLTEKILIENIPCIIKTNNDSGGGIIIRCEEDINIEAIRLKLKNRLKTNYFPRTREWQYKNIKPCIIVEKLLLDENGNIPSDYKFHCFNGRVRMIQIDLNRGTKNHFRNWYNKHWKPEPYYWASPKADGQKTLPSKELIKPPEKLEKLISLSEDIAKLFIYSRIDWYVVKGKIFFGEITFHHDSGVQPIVPKKWDYELGAELKLK